MCDLGQHRAEPANYNRHGCRSWCDGNTSRIIFLSQSKPQSAPSLVQIANTESCASKKKVEALVVFVITIKNCLTRVN